MMPRFNVCVGWIYLFFICGKNYILTPFSLNIYSLFNEMCNAINYMSLLGQFQSMFSQQFFILQNVACCTVNDDFALIKYDHPWE